MANRIGKLTAMSAVLGLTLMLGACSFIFDNVTGGNNNGPAEGGVAPETKGGLTITGLGKYISGDYYITKVIGTDGKGNYFTCGLDLDISSLPPSMHPVKIDNDIITLKVWLEGSRSEGYLPVNFEGNADVYFSVSIDNDFYANNGYGFGEVIVELRNGTGTGTFREVHPPPGFNP